MRLRRLCEKKKSGSCHVKESVHADYVAGGERREILELALLETLEKLGDNKDSHTAMKSEFVSRVEHVKERLLEREKEVTGEWLTAERMESKLGYSKILVSGPVCTDCLMATNSQPRFKKTMSLRQCPRPILF